MKVRFSNLLRNKEERVLKIAGDEINYFCDLIPIRNRVVREEAIKLYKELYERGFTKGRNRFRVIGALLYILCCEYELPVFLEDIEFFTQEKAEKIEGVVRDICEELKINFKPHSPEVGLVRYGYELGMEQSEITEALRVIYEAKARKLLSNDVKVDMGTALLLAKEIELRRSFLRRVARRLRVREDELLRNFERLRRSLICNHFRETKNL